LGPEGTGPAPPPAKRGAGCLLSLGGAGAGPPYRSCLPGPCFWCVWVACGCSGWGCGVLVVGVGCLGGRGVFVNWIVDASI
jgi:hypothetical protein